MYTLKQISIIVAACCSVVFCSSSYAASYKTIKVKSSSKCIEMAFDGSLIQNTCNNFDRQQFLITQIASGNSIITTKSNTVGCLTVPGGRFDDDLQIVEENCNNSDHQQYTFTPLGNHYYTINPVHSNKCFDVPNGNTSDGMPVNQHYCDGTNEQSFIFYDVVQAGNQNTNTQTGVASTRPTIRHTIGNSGLTIAVPNDWTVESGLLGLSIYPSDGTLAVALGVVDGSNISAVSQQIENELTKAGVTNVQGTGTWKNKTMRSGKQIRLTEATGNLNNQVLDIGIIGHDTNHGQTILIFGMAQQGGGNIHGATFENIVQSLK